MSNVTIKDILTLPDNTLLDSVQGTVTEVYQQRHVRGDKVVQDAKLRDGTGAEVKLAVWDHPPIDTYKGREVIIQSGPKGGLKVQLDTYRQPHANTISASKTATFQFLEVHHAQNGTTASANLGVRPAPANGVVPQQAASSNPPIVVNGAKVGMSVNNAVLFMTSAGEPFDSTHLHRIASAILKVSVRLENGDIFDPNVTTV